MKWYVFIAFLIAVVLTAGCTTAVPVKMKFPEVPAELLEKCPELKKLQDESKLSDVATTVTLNYTTYYQCAAKHEAFIYWYNNNKKIYESVNK